MPKKQINVKGYKRKVKGRIINVKPHKRRIDSVDPALYKQAQVLSKQYRDIARERQGTQDTLNESIGKKKESISELMEMIHDHEDDKAPKLGSVADTADNLSLKIFDKQDELKDQKAQEKDTSKDLKSIKKKIKKEQKAAIKEITK